MPPASHGFIIKSMLLESSICLLILFKGILSTRVLALGYGSKRRSRKKRENTNFVEDTVIVTRSK
jgi:hypothetical protein